MSKINTGNRSKAEDAKALDALIEEANAASGQKVVEIDGMKFIETQSFGLTVRTRIA